MELREVEISSKYKLREDGKVFNIKTGEEVFLTKVHKGFLININKKTRPIHQLMMEYFGPPKPGPEYVVLHKNRDNFDNNINNLIWATRKDVSSRLKKPIPDGMTECEYKKQKQNLASLKYYRNNKNVINEKKRKKYSEDPEYYKEQSRTYYKEHEEIRNYYKEYNKKYRKEHKLEYNFNRLIKYNTDLNYRNKCIEQVSIYQKFKYQNDPVFKENLKKYRDKQKTKQIILQSLWNRNNKRKQTKKYNKHSIDRVSYKDLT